MGFYGNISNINKSSFQFDKTYSNRYEMDSNANSDDIFVGRYVLVDYEYIPDSDSSLPYYAYQMNGHYPIRSFGYVAKIEKEDGTLANLVDPRYGNQLIFAGLNLEHPFTLSETGANHGDTITEDTFIYVLGYFTVVEREDELDVDTDTLPACLRARYQVKDVDVVRYSDIELKKIYKAVLAEKDKQELDPETGQYVPAKDEDDKPIKINVLDYETLMVEIPEPTSSEKEIAYNFQNNYRIDSIAYGSYGRGWDSTVWQKVYKDGVYSYKMIAELNSVVPTFDLTIDPNTIPPIAPHFDTDNTNLYYNLHIQPSWNFRVRKYEKDAYDVIDPESYYDYASDEAERIVYTWEPASVYKKNDYVEIDWQYDNDESHTIKRTFKSLEEGNQNIKPLVSSNWAKYWVEIFDDKKDLAIYYNKTGFDKYQYSYSNKENKISIKPTGIGYRNLLSIDDENRSPDTMEFVMMLPAIGNAISNMWDVVYGKPVDNDGIFENKDNKRVNDLSNRKTLWDRNGSNENRLFVPNTVGLRNTNIAWNSYNGLRPLQYDGTYDYSTLKSLASTINYSHDLMGMIIRNNGNLGEVSEWDPTKIYEINGKFYKKGKVYSYETIASADVESTLENFEEFTPIDLFDVHGTKNIDGVEYSYYRKTAEQLEQYDEPDDADIVDISNMAYWNYIAVKPEDEPIDGATYGYLVGTDQIEYQNDWELSSDYVPNRYHIYLPATSSSLAQFKVATSFKPEADEKYYDLHNKGKIEKLGTDLVFYDSNAYYAGLKQNPTDWDNKYYFMTSDFDLFISCAKFPTLVDLYNYVKTLGEGYQVKFFNKSDIVVDYSSTSFIEDKDRPITKIIVGDISLTHNQVVIDGAQYWTKNYTLGEVEYTERIPASFVYKEGNNYINYSTYTYVIEQPEDAEEQLGPLDGFTLDEIIQNGYTPIFEDTTPPQPKKIYELVPTSGRTEYNLIANSQAVKLSDVNGLFFRNLEIIDDPKWNDETNTWENEIILFKENISDFLRNYKIVGTQYYYRYNLGCYYIVTYDSKDANTYFYKIDSEGYYFKDGNDYVRETVSKTNLESTKDNYYFRESELYNKNIWQLETKSPFIPFKYYIINEHGEYVLAPEFDPEETYYKRNAICVTESDTDVFPVGTVWNKEVTVLPPTVALGRRNETWGAIEIPEFGKNLGTIHGSILKASEMMLYGDKDTRDTSTIQGSINTMNDVIHRFHTLTPGEQVMVDVYGRIHSGDYDTRQSGSFVNVGKPSENGTISEAENRWIKYTPDSNYENTLKPHFKLEHQLAYTTPDTVTVADKNLDAINQGDGLNASAGDTIDLYTPIVDSQGHIIGKNTETVTLPYGFKTITTNGRVSNDNTEILAEQADLVAENTQDILTINSGNEWIKIETTPLTDVITISHDVKNTSSTTSALDLSNENDGTITFDIPTYTFDATNHYSGHDVKTLTMPNSYGKFTGDNGVGSEATSTHDTFSLTGDSWIQTTAIKDNIAFAHIGPVETTHTAVANETPAFGSTFTITDWTFDAKGHKANSGTHTVMIPQGSLMVTENTDGAKVLTSIGFTPTTGAIVSTNKNVGTLPITDYSSLSSISSMPVATDSINTAIGKLAYVLDNDTTQVNIRINDAINALDATLSQNADTDGLSLNLIQVDGVITEISGSIASETYDEYGSANTAEQNAKDYADTLVTDEVISNKVITATEDPEEQEIPTATLSEMLRRIIELEKILNS